MIGIIKTFSLLFGTAMLSAPMITPPNEGVQGPTRTEIEQGICGEVYQDIEVVSKEEVIRQIDGAEYALTLVTVKNTGDKLVDPKSVSGYKTDYNVQYSPKDNLGLDCLLGKDETFVFSFRNYDSIEDVSKCFYVSAYEEDTTSLWSHSSLGYGSWFRNMDGYYQMQVIPDTDSNNPYKNSNYYQIEKRHGIAYYTVDGTPHASTFQGDYIFINSHESLESAVIEFTKIDYIYVKGYKLTYPDIYIDDDLISDGFFSNAQAFFDTPLVVLGCSILGIGLVVGGAIVAKILVDKKYKKEK